jgi:hypothetical protein
MLADAVGEAFNPPDGDEGEVSLLITAVENARAMLAAFTCYCTPGDDDPPCMRCSALGQWHGKPVQR